MRRLWILLGVMVMVLVVGGCSASEDNVDGDASSATTTPAPDGIHELIDDYLASWETKDEPALRATVADGFVINEYIYLADTGKSYETINGDADDIVSKGWNYDWQNDIVGDLVVSGDGLWTVRFRELWQEGSAHLDGIATYTVVDEGGTLKIARHSWAGFRWLVWEQVP
jgi:hypothetical protein